jgi:hypothetical protein
MEENGFFTKHQHGFRKGRSCATQLIEVMEQWTEIIFGEYGADFDFVHTLYDLKSFYYICSDSPILQCW